MTPGGVEPRISGLRNQCPSKLDDGAVAVGESRTPASEMAIRRAATNTSTAWTEDERFELYTDWYALLSRQAWHLANSILREPQRTLER